MKFSIIKIVLIMLACFLLPNTTLPVEPKSGTTQTNNAGHHAPIDVLVDDSQRWLISANEQSGSVSLIDLVNGIVVDEVICGENVSDVAWAESNKDFLVVSPVPGHVTEIEIDANKLKVRRILKIGAEPTGIAVNPEAHIAYITQMTANQVIELDLQTGSLGHQYPVGSWSRYLTLSPDGTRLAVGSSGEGSIYVIDTVKQEVLYDQPLSGGINLGRMRCDAKGEFVYFPWMIYRSNPITPDMIRRGWVLASRIGRVRLGGPAYREAISLDVPRLAVADPFGIAISNDQQRLVVSASGTHELLFYRLPDLPFVGVGGPGDLIDGKLMSDQDLFSRIELGGRPMSIVFGKDDRTIYVANDTRDSVQIVDFYTRRIVKEISLDDKPNDSLVHQGRELFYDGRRSLDQWYSCHTCHYNGGTNARPMDTWNDGSGLTLKTVLPLYQVRQSKPWTWHGWQNDLGEAMQKSFTSTMQGEPISRRETEAILAFLDSIKPPVNPIDTDDPAISSAIERGKEVFNSQAAGCSNCHAAPRFTDEQIHDVGTGSKADVYHGYNTPSLLGIGRKTRFLHDGREKNL